LAGNLIRRRKWENQRERLLTNKLSKNAIYLLAFFGLTNHRPNIPALCGK